MSAFFATPGSVITVPSLARLVLSLAMALRLYVGLVELFIKEERRARDNLRVPAASPVAWSPRLKQTKRPQPGKQTDVIRPPRPL